MPPWCFECVGQAAHGIRALKNNTPAALRAAGKDTRASIGEALFGDENCYCCRGIGFVSPLLELGGNPSELIQELGFVAVQLVEKITIAHQMEHGAAKVLLFLLCVGSDALNCVCDGRTIGPDQARMPVTALHPREGRRFQGRDAVQAPQDSGHHVDELRVDQSLGLVGIEKLGAELLEMARILPLDDKTPSRQPMFQ